MTTIAAKLGASVLAPFMMFGGMMPSSLASLYHAPLRTDVNQPALEITSIAGPTALAVNQDGTWTVRVNEATSTQNLQYSVNWGDTNAGVHANALMQPIMQSSATFTHAYAVKGSYRPTFTVTDDQGHTVTKTAVAVRVTAAKAIAPNITSITPASGQAGTLVTLSGSGFASSTIVHFGNGIVKNASVQSSSSLSFTVPTTKPAGTYNVWVNGGGNGKSNSVQFTVVATPIAHLSVNGIDAPAMLTVGEDGTWTVHAGTNVSGNLHYSVVWGDENTMLRALAMVMPQTTQTSATFTHAYGTAGSYQPTFTITDDAGDTVTASASVNVVTQ